jgi:hypothetical protein
MKHYYSDHIKENKMDWVFRMHGDIRSTYKYLIRKCNGNRALGRLKHKWKNNIKMGVT